MSMQRFHSGAAPPRAQRRTASRWAWTLASCALALVPGSQAASVSEADLPSFWAPFSLDRVASNLQRLADQVPEEHYHQRLFEPPSGCNCAEQDDPNTVEASADVKDEDFQVGPHEGEKQEEFDDDSGGLQPSYAVTLLERNHRRVARHQQKSGCKCGSKALSLASSGTGISPSGEGGDLEVTPTGIWLNTCQYAQPDLVFWRLTNTAYLRGGIVLKETIAYTDSCKMCDYNNVACNKKEVELTDGNCLCMWRMNGVEMDTELLACSACVTDCIGKYKSFDLGKPEPGMQKGMCLRKKPHKSLDDLKPLTPALPLDVSPFS